MALFPGERHATDGVAGGHLSDYVSPGMAGTARVVTGSPAMNDRITALNSETLAIMGMCPQSSMMCTGVYHPTFGRTSCAKRSMVSSA